MPGPLRNAVLGAVAATVIAGCGSDDGTIPPREAENLLTRLQAVDENVQSGQCEDAQVQAEEFSAEVNDLSGDVDREVRRALEESASNLVVLANSDCEPEDGATGPTGPVTTDTTQEPLDTTTTTTTTEPTTTDTEPETEPEEEEDRQEEPQGGSDDNQGNDGPGGGAVGADGGVSPSGGVSGGGGSGGGE